MKSFFHMAARAAVLIMAVSCTEDPTEEGFFRSDEECSLSMDVGFTSFSPALDTRTSGTAVPGEIQSLNVLFYDAAASEDESKLVYFFRGTTTGGATGKPDGTGNGTFSFDPSPTERTESDRPADTKDLDENSTDKAQFTLNGIARGRYRIYVVANMPWESRDDVPQDDKGRTVTALRNHKLTWNAESIAANNAMFGYFMTGESSEKNVIRTDAPILSVSGPMDMHAWLKRAVSKVTVAFDGTNLDENVYIYIKSVQIKDIPKTCLLGNNNTPKNESELDGNGETIIYDEGSGETNIQDRITRGNPYYPRKTSASESDSDWKARVHSADNANSLFFFENVQENGIDDEKDEDGSYKPQTDSNYDRIPDDNDENYGNHNFKVQKDRRPYGTYIEVKAYYRNDGNYEVSRGDIIYRFMLGKDHLTSFDVERSIHYKVTLKFNNNANDVDWHIELDEDPGIYVPETYYVSYNYNEMTMLPIRVVGNMTGNLKAEIIENNWGGPSDKASALNQYPYQVGFGTGNGDPYGYAENAHGAVINGICNGFLQLRKLVDNDKFEIGANTASNSGPLIKFNENYWYSYANGTSTARRYDENLGVREYDQEGTLGNTDADNFGLYDVNTEKEPGTTSFNIPLYTRQMKLMSTTGYSGANPYYSIEGTREAKIRFTATVEGKKEEKIVTILQRPRIENPTGIWRAWNSAEPFNVTLQYRETESEDNLHFSPVHSFGPWTATVTQGTSFITLDVLENGRKDSDTSIHGYTDTDVKFTVNFNGTCSNATEVRCGIITVTYHNNSCTHRIFVRQGYAPLAVVNGGAKWHSFNLVSSGVEAESPCEEGSMFRPGNLTQPISEVNNTRGNFNRAAGTLALAPSGSAAWSGIRRQTYSNSNSTPFGSESLAASNHSDMGYTTGRMPIWKDFRPLIKSNNIKIAFGVLYADGATQENDGIGAFTYTKGGSQANGMRGIFIYNVDDGRNIFLPIGKSGYGRRYVGKNDDNGKLRYANRDAAMTQAEARYRPLLYSIYTNEGAIYWSGKFEHQDQWSTNSAGQRVHDYDLSPGVEQGDLDNGLNPTYAFDINYKTYDLNGFGTNMSTGACYIRLVSD